MYTCPVCKNHANNKKINVHEMMFGYDDEFVYRECGQCKRLEIEEVPKNLHKYYPENKYYSLRNSADYNDPPRTLKNLLEKIKFDYLLFGRHEIAGRILSFNYIIPAFYEWLKVAAVIRKSAILDVGCGNGIFLNRLRKMGFINLTGVDPFNKEIVCVEGMVIYNKTIFDITGQYDFIMSHHSFEHMPEPEKHLKRLKELLHPNGILLIRTPVTDSYCWKNYGTNWVALDAPRHLHIESHKSMEILCKNAGLSIFKIRHDAEAFQIMASEQYIKGIRLNDTNSFFVKRNYSLFSKQQIKEYKKQMAELNDRLLGGDACFYIKHPAGNKVILP